MIENFTISVLTDDKLSIKMLMFAALARPPKMSLAAALVAWEVISTSWLEYVYICFSAGSSVKLLPNTSILSYFSY
jgi:hypothetical protein